MTESEAKLILNVRISRFDHADDVNMALEVAKKALEEIQQYHEIGTVEEVREVLQIISEGQDDVDESGISTGLLHTLLKYGEYVKIGTVEECREAREKQIAKKPDKRTDKHTDLIQYYWCPVCGRYFGQAGIYSALLLDKPKYCTCGQAIDWTE